MKTNDEILQIVEQALIECYGVYQGHLIYSSISTKVEDALER